LILQDTSYIGGSYINTLGGSVGKSSNSLGTNVGGIAMGYIDDKGQVQREVRRTLRSGSG